MKKYLHCILIKEFNYLFMAKIFYLYCFSLFFLSVFATASVVKSEKIYFSLVQDEIQAGDTLAVSGLLVEAQTYGLPYSRYVYVELLDKCDSVILRQKLSCDSGLFSTYIPVDMFQAPGIYYVRAYTRLMQNVPPWTYPIRAVGIGQPLVLPEFPSTNEIHSVRFYPEGGRLVSGCLQQVVFEVKDVNGNPLRVLGKLRVSDKRRERKDSILLNEVTTGVDGCGVIRFMPEDGAVYSLFIRNPIDGSTVFYPLPDADTIPSLQLTINRNKLRYTLVASPNWKGKCPFALFYRGAFFFQDTLSQQHSSGIIDISAYPSGLYAGILLNASGSVIAERLIFSEGGKLPLPPILEMDRTVYSPGEMAKITFSPSDSLARYLVWVKKEQAEGNFSGNHSREFGVDVTASRKKNNTETIMSYLELSSELECPLSYMTGIILADNSLDLQAVDKLLICKKWKRYVLYDLWQNELFLPYQPEMVMALCGRVESEWGNRLKKGGLVVALDPDNGFTYTAEILTNSRFQMAVDDFLEGHSFFMQAYNQKGKSYNFKVIPDNNIYPEVMNPLKYFYVRKKRGDAHLDVRTYGEITYSYDKDNRKNYHLPEIEVSARVHKAETKLNRIFEPFKITEEQIDQFAYPDIIPLLERMVGFKVKKVSLDPSDTSDDPMNFRYGIFSTRGVSVMRGSEDPHDYQPGEMPIILDGVLTDTHQVITLYPPQVIRSIERLTPAKALAYTSVAMNGALLIKTRGWKETEFVSKGIHYMPEGLSPLALPPPSLPCTVRVPDKEGVYLIVAEGIDGEGNPRRFTREIRVAR